MTERITLVEIDLNRCSNTYGSAPCTASGVECFNGWATCQDKANYTQETVTARYSMATDVPPANIDAIASIETVNIRPAKLELGESIGVRASIDITFKDHRSPDTGPEGDRYLTARDYDPYTRGTYWGKFRARFPFTQGSEIRLIRGYSDQDVSQMETRHFIVDSVEGPNSSGAFTIKCKDALKLADGKKSQCPVLSNGELSANILSTDTSFTITPAGEGEFYPTIGWVAIGGDEIIAYTTRTGDTFSGLTRGDYYTQAQDHDQGARVQLCVKYDSEKVTDIITDLLTNYSNVPVSYIPSADWAAEDDTYIQRTYTTLIAEPTPVNDLVNELLVQTASTIWWDDIGKAMRFRVLKAVDSGAALYDDDFIVAGSFSARDQNDKRVSQVWTYFGLLNPLENLDEPKNYSRTQVTVSPESELNFEGTPSIRRIYSRWITEAGRDAAQRLNLLILSRYTTPPRLISFNLHRDNKLTIPELAGGYKVNSWTIQDATGAAVDTPVQVVQMKSNDDGFNVLAEEVLYSETVAPGDPSIKTISIESSRLNVDLYQLAIDAPFTAPTSGDTYIFRITSGVIVGSISPAQAALITGTGWPSGVTLRLEISAGAYVVGAGGKGGNAATTTSPATTSAENGTNGGNALDATGHALEVNNGGTIGGGGGGGGGAACFLLSSPANAGGGGGAGSVIGLGGSSSLGYNGASGGLTSGGAGGNDYGIAIGGAGGGLGVVGSAGFTDTSTQLRVMGTGGSPGNAVTGNSNITWIATGTRLGAIV